MDSRLYPLFQHCIHFDWSPEKIIINDSNYTKIKYKVTMFRNLIKNNYLITWNEKSPEQYFNMLYSKKDFFDYHYSDLIKSVG